MKRIKYFIFWALVSLWLAPSAAAQGLIGRQLVVNRGTLRIDAGQPDFALGTAGFVNNESPQGLTFRRPKDSDVITTLSLGATYGLFNDLEVGGVFLPMELSPDGDFGDIQLFGRYQLVSFGGAMLGVQAGIQIPTDSDFGFDAGVPLRVSLGSLQLDTGAELEFVFAENNDIINANFPVAITGSFIGPLVIGVESGLYFIDFDADLLTIPAGVFTGFTIPGKTGPFIDLKAQLLWEAFITPGLDDKFGEDSWALNFSASIFIDLGG